MKTKTFIFGLLSGLTLAALILAAFLGLVTNLTRAQIAPFWVLAYRLMTGKEPAVVPTPFVDLGQADAFQQKAIAQAWGVAIMAGTSTNAAGQETFRPTMRNSPQMFFIQLGSLFWSACNCW